jgi:hypothetical protein
VGGTVRGLRSALANDPSLHTVGNFAPKFKVLAESSLFPEGTAVLDTKHVVYSNSVGTLSALAYALAHVHSLQTSEQQDVNPPLFKQLTPDVLRWNNGQVELISSRSFPIQPGQLVFIVLTGLKADKDKLLAAFGRMTADNTRHKGLFRSDGTTPLVQMLLDSHEIRCCSATRESRT